MSLTGILLDVSRSMESNIGSGTDEEGGPWARSIFKVIDDLIEHDVTSENQVFALGVGANCSQKEIFDVIGTVQRATEDHINKIFDILEQNDARNIRKWTNVNLVQEVVSDCMAALILMKLESDEQFLRKFVDEFLPSACRDKISLVPSPWENAAVVIGGGVAFLAFGPVALLGAGVVSVFGRVTAVAAENFATTAVSNQIPATEEDIHQVVEKAKRYLLEKGENVISLKEVGANSIFTVQDASRIIRGCIGETELSKERSQELLKNVEPFIYGRTPLYQSLDKATELFQRHSSKCANDNKLLFVLSDGDPTDTGKIDEVVSKLREQGVKVVSSFITKSTDIQPKRLYDKMLPDWEPGAKFLFPLSSELPTQILPRTILVKRGWTIDVANNETKLFMQANHPDHLREACNMARDVVCCQDALSDLLVSVDLDLYINQSTDSFEAKDQGKAATCYAHACATVLHLAMKRILGREGGYPEFDALKNELIKRFGIHGANTSLVLDEICPKYRLRCRDVHPKEAKQAIAEKRPVVAMYRFTKREGKIFNQFYKNDRYGILTENEIDASNHSAQDTTYGHAVVLTSYNSKCLILMNSRGPAWADNGFFRVQNANVLEMDFFDVYWKLEDLTEGEKTYYDDHGREVATKLMTSLKGLQKAEYTCPECSETSLVTAFTGTLLNVKCPKCSQEFSTNDNAGNVLALNMYLTSLSR